jgi:hypothetical protein
MLRSISVAGAWSGACAVSGGRPLLAASTERWREEPILLVMTDNFAIAMLFSRSATLSKKRCLSTSLFLLCARYPRLQRWGSAEIEGALSGPMLSMPSLKARPVIERCIGEDVHLKMRECPARAGKITAPRAIGNLRQCCSIATRFEELADKLPRYAQARLHPTLLTLL